MLFRSRDDAPHDRLTEWWYVTGHLTTLDGTRAFGYEAVIFRAIRGDFPVTWASHMALTEKPRAGREGSFTYYERAEIGPQVDISALIDGPVAAAFAITGADPLDPATFENEPWSMIVGLDGSMLIGYHTGSTHMTGILGHSFMGLMVREVKLNDRTVSEGGFSAEVANHYGAPIIMISGDDAFCEETQGLIGNVEAAVVKWAYGTLSARSMVPEAAYALIRDKIGRAHV